ncbi:MAG: carboxyltransferase domain-containing protein, partial [Burkholderiales bacterium]|nr:carboxyltransferase domain-containing protein [Burkholderiales bacterium]
MSTKPASSAARDGLPRIVAVGDSAVLAEFATTLDMAVNARIQRIARRVRAQAPPWVHDVVPSMAALAVHFDADAVAAADPEAAGARIAAAREELGRLIAAC